MTTINLPKTGFAGLTEVYHGLSAFLANSHVPVDENDTRGQWVIDKEEKIAIKRVLDCLEDCGAETDPEKAFS